MSARTTATATTRPTRPARPRSLARSVSRRTAAGILATGLLAPAGLALGTAPASAGVDTEAGFVTAINHARVNHGESRLIVRSDLVEVAREQAQRMANKDLLYHNPNLTTDVHNWLVVGENVGYGPDVSSLVTAFMQSPEHRANILSTDYRDVGIGTVIRNGVLWVSEVFRKPASSEGLRRAHFHHKLRTGSFGKAVAWVQHRLGVPVDGLYGPVTERAVYRFKRHHAMRHNGIVSRKTWRALHR